MTGYFKKITCAFTVCILSLSITGSAQQKAKNGRQPRVAAPDRAVTSKPDKEPEAGYFVGEYLSNNLHYPHSARTAGIQGKVIVQFVVTKTGAITDVQVINPVSPELDAEALRVVKAMPKWEKPGKIRGRPVNVVYKVPVVFGIK